VTSFSRNEWALILGGSSGFGLATARKLAAHGMSVCVVHRDRRGAMPRIEQAFDEIRQHGHGFLALNLDALSPDGVTTTLDALRTAMGESGRVKALLHSIAFGNLKPIAPPVTPGADAPMLMDDEDIARTVYSMGTSLLTWVQRLHAARLFAADARVFGLTSEGNAVSWKGYAAVAAAKVALESLSRAIAVEFGPHGIRSNILQPGVTDTPALRLIPGSGAMTEHALKRNPLGRLTLPEDVANVVYLLCAPEAAWVNGALIRVDGGEHVAA
jgi:NAD(P)-dependent dehydrogenase (short-subunit alcohol dehydrogenase family)